jgi:hypothetical protein
MCLNSIKEGKAMKNVKKSESKGKATRKAIDKTTTEKPVSKTAFGFRAGGKKMMFVESLAKATKSKEGSITMKQIRELPWNDNHAAYPGTLGQLKTAGLAVSDKGNLSLTKKGLALFEGK